MKQFRFFQQRNKGESTQYSAHLCHPPETAVEEKKLMKYHWSVFVELKFI